MKKLITFLAVALLATGCYHRHKDGNAAQKSLDRATLAIRDAFERGDIPAIVALHYPDIVKYLGGNNVIVGRTGLTKQLTDMFKNNKLEFIENKVESTVFAGRTAIQTVLFTIKVTPKNGGQPTLAKGRSMVVYVRDKTSPTGWYSLREMAQEGPEK